jgi:hypothetical protein
MTNAQVAIAAENQRRKIPDRWALTFTEITNVELASITTDEKLRPEVRAYALWELEYREAFGIEVVYDAESDQIKRRRN